MIISPFTPLFFLNRKADGRDSDYMQTFATTDKILIEVIGTTSDVVPDCSVFDGNGKFAFDVNLKTWDINLTDRLFFAEISLGPGIYQMSMEGLGDSELFRVTDDARELAKTTLIQYSMKNNRQRKDAVFFINKMHYFFDWRVPGGFKDSGWSFGCESEQFVTPTSDIAQLYGLESTQKKFTLGNSQGCPVWFGAMLNRILVCSHVYFDGVKYTRKESNVPESSPVMEGVNSFVFTQTLQESVNLDPKIEAENHLVMRRVDDTDYRAVDDNNNNRIIY